MFMFKILTMRNHFYGEGEPNAGAPPAADPTAGVKTFTQEQVNAFIKKEKDALTAKNNETIERYKKLEQSQTLSEQEKEELRTQITTLQDEGKSKEQLAQEALGRANKENQLKIDAEIAEKKAWRGHFENLLRDTDLKEAAKAYGAKFPEDILAHLMPLTKVVEIPDAEGKPSGQFEVKIKWSAEDKDKKPVILELTPMDAVKRMTEIPDRFGHHFNNSAKDGLSGTSNQSPVGNIAGMKPLESMSLEDYRKNRPAIMQQLAKTR